MSDDFNAFVPGPRVRIEGRAGGPLSGLTFAAKDLFDVAGHPTGGGNPDWARVQPVPTRHAWAVQRLLDAGATLIGKTITDEVSLGILGENPFDGTPVNPRAPGRVPGGSSAGSAAAVAAGLCDTALGTDTGGSVRVPASFCGLYGIRPTHGRLDLTGMMTQAPTSDTTGWFARDADTFARVSAVMLGEAIPAALPTPAGRRRPTPSPSPTRKSAPRCSRWSTRLGRLIGEVREEAMAPPGSSPGRGRSARCSPPRPGRPSRTGSSATTRASQFSVARNLVSGSLIPASERQWAQPGAPRGARPDAPAAAARHDPVPADDAVPGADVRPAAIGRSASRDRITVPVRPWRADRRAASQHPRRHRRRRPGRPLDHRRPRQRRDPRRRRSRARGISLPAITPT